MSRDFKVLSHALDLSSISTIPSFKTGILFFNRKTCTHARLVVTRRPTSIGEVVTLT